MSVILILCKDSKLVDNLKKNGKLEVETKLRCIIIVWCTKSLFILKKGLGHSGIYSFSSFLCKRFDHVTWRYIVLFPRVTLVLYVSRRFAVCGRFVLYVTGTEFVAVAEFMVDYWYWVLVTCMIWVSRYQQIMNFWIQWLRKHLNIAKIVEQSSVIYAKIQEWSPVKHCLFSFTKKSFIYFLLNLFPIESIRFDSLEAS